MPQNAIRTPKFLDVLFPTLPSTAKNRIVRATHEKGLHTGAQSLSRFAFPSLLKKCAAQPDLRHGKRIHASIIQTGLQFDPFIASSLINMYARCGSLTDAQHVFAQLPQRDAAVWNAMIAGYFHHGCRHEALSLFYQLQLSGVRPDGHLLSILLGGCSANLDLWHGRQVHAFLVRNASDSDSFLGTALIDMYAECGEVTGAYRVFRGMVDKKDASLWNAMIGGFCHNGLWEEGLELFVLMKNWGLELQSTTFSSTLTACSTGEVVAFGEGVHCCLIKLGFELDPYVCTCLLGMYGRCGLLDEARRVLESARSKGTELWNSMISAYVNSSYALDALNVYKQMRLSDIRSDCITISNVLSSCSIVSLLDFGKGVHGELIKRPERNNMMVRGSLINMYMKCGSTEDAGLLFNLGKDWDVIVWGSMIAGYCQNKKYDRALNLFNKLRVKGLDPDSAIIASVASACAGLGFLVLGYQIHGFAIKSGTSFDVFVASALIDMYAKCGLPQLAGIIFSGLPCKNIVVCNSMISGYGRNGLLDESISTLARISQHGLVPDSISISSLLASVSSLAVLEKGKMIHGYQIRNEVICDSHVENALLDMYMKCGCLKYGQSIFDRMHLRNMVAWNTMITGYGHHGYCLKAIGLFEEMKRLRVLPDEATFLSLISSCSHSGLVEEGMAFFRSMSRDYGIGPRMEHYLNMVDLLGRAGRLDEAYCFIKAMPTKAGESVWLCFLSACRAYRHMEFGEIAADHLLKLKPEGSGSFTQLLNFYGEVGLFGKAAKVKLQMKELGLKKNPGCSWIEVKDRIQVFFSSDSSPLITEIHDTLRNLRRSMREEEKFS
ncbi:pentatricopeptide repeat-containing protein At2g40720 isoform X1 [Phoenix dactylifera]|uniref:Pentatricopeptide repeat-containing protein At2g40720 isoform X1 n=1 Tax=Phoenix dactylifera TaxID=42345 RepID=A0A8B8J5D2_PHODC|nr:pentatricopeptide repeat-containing protein At2g40720 isoform X1 [Phoenix dactylifera]